MVERIKKVSGDFTSSEEIDALIVASKTEIEDREKLFNKIYEKTKDLIFDGKTNSNALRIEDFELIMIEIKKIMDVPRFNTAWKLGLPEFHWDYFEQSDFIHFMRDKKEEQFKELLKEYKGGKYSRK